MTVDPSVIAALETAVQAGPDNHPVRLHLASLLLMSGDAGSALEHAGIVLAAIPDHVEALLVARDASRAAGDGQRAASYDRLLGITEGALPVLGSPPPEDERRVPADHGSGSGDDEAAIDDLTERPAVTLADVGGLAEVKQRLELAFLAPLRNPEARAYYGKSLRGGLLLYGPPGCGKTFIARAWPASWACASARPETDY